MARAGIGPRGRLSQRRTGEGKGSPMNRHLESLGLAVAYPDLGMIPQTIRSAYEKGATLNELGAAIERGSVLSHRPAAVRAVAMEVAHPWA